MNGYEILLFDILIVFFTGLGLREIFRFFSRQYVNMVQSLRNIK